MFISLTIWRTWKLREMERKWETTKGMTETEGERATGGKKCPFSGVTSGCGGLIPDRVMAQDSVDSTDSFDEKVEKGQGLPPGHPPVDIASLTPVGANTAPKNPMLDLRMFCPKFASEEGGEHWGQEGHLRWPWWTNRHGRLRQGVPGVPQQEEGVGEEDPARWLRLRRRIRLKRTPIKTDEN